LPDLGEDLVLGDLNDDTALDLIGLRRIAFNDGTGHFSAPTPLPNPNDFTDSVAVGDLNGDGALDIVLGNPFTLSQVYLNEARS
jgi:hypothetical protein